MQQGTEQAYHLCSFRGFASDYQERGEGGLRVRMNHLCFHVGVYCCQFDEEKLVSGGADCRVVVWDMASGKELRIFTGHTQEVVRRGKTWCHLWSTYYSQLCMYTVVCAIQ